VTFGDENQLVDEIRVEVTGVELADGRVVDVVGTLSNIDYEIAETDDMIVEAGSFNMVANTDTPAVVITADVFDPEGDTLIFTVDASATLGEVVNNGDGTFTYDAGDTFEYLNTGETATDSFYYTVDDGNGGMVTELVSITINGADEYWV
jgi:VCBS repeat-containing protein